MRADEGRAREPVPAPAAAQTGEEGRTDTVRFLNQKAAPWALGLWGELWGWGWGRGLKGTEFLFGKMESPGDGRWPAAQHGCV